jgi:hypothetical protein
MENIEHCQTLTKKYSSQSNIDFDDRFHNFLIKERYYDNQEVISVRKIPFSPYDVDKKNICNIE